jgi:hypothetical protein
LETFDLNSYISDLSILNRLNIISWIIIWAIAIRIMRDHPSIFVEQLRFSDCLRLLYIIFVYLNYWCIIDISTFAKFTHWFSRSKLRSFICCTHSCIIYFYWCQTVLYKVIINLFFNLSSLSNNSFRTTVAAITVEQSSI